MFAIRRLVSAQLERARAGLLRRACSAGSEGEARISGVLHEKFPTAKQVRVVDVSGGCGAMYEVHVEAEEFRGKRVVMQHLMINQALKDEIKGMHGLRIFTTVPEKQSL